MIFICYRPLPLTKLYGKASCEQLFREVYICCQCKIMFHNSIISLMMAILAILAARAHGMTKHKRIMEGVVLRVSAYNVHTYTRKKEQFTLIFKNGFHLMFNLVSANIFYTKRKIWKFYLRWIWSGSYQFDDLQLQNVVSRKYIFLKYYTHLKESSCLEIILCLMRCSSFS